MMKLAFLKPLGARPKKVAKVRENVNEKYLRALLKIAHRPIDPNTPQQERNMIEVARKAVIDERFPS